MNRARLARHIAVSRGYLLAAAFILTATACSAEETRPFEEATREGGELEYMDGIPVLFLQGEPEAMGRQYGLLFGEAARPLASLPKEMLGAQMVDSRGDFGENPRGLHPRRNPCSHLPGRCSRRFSPCFHSRPRQAART